MRSFLLVVLLVLGETFVQLVIGDGSPTVGFGKGHQGNNHPGGLDTGETPLKTNGAGDPLSNPGLVTGANSEIPSTPNRMKRGHQGGIVSEGNIGRTATGDPESVPELISEANSGGPFAKKHPQEFKWIREEGGRLIQVRKDPLGGLISGGKSGGPFGTEDPESIPVTSNHEQGGLISGGHSGGPLGITETGDPESVPGLISGANSGGPFAKKPPQKFVWVREKGGRLVQIRKDLLEGQSGGTFGTEDPESNPVTSNKHQEGLVSGGHSGGPFGVSHHQGSSWSRKKEGRPIRESPFGEDSELVTGSRIRKQQVMELKFEQ
ncbi:uncharacterized transmembrane protein DDB_G0289901 [Drosophila biarmipes]|uniref:uncharacterized transmembrane protein DDB_G0289901 n=1 Tax=Drosophila biarmipes TaxID=125945 RepID=UPI0007E6A0D9|nr:uncharacterized transmembrane protein DDB_G0289901 [Drosophila biarmipes]